MSRVKAGSVTRSRHKKILKRAKNSIGSILCEIDLEKVDFYRRRIPAMTEF